MEKRFKGALLGLACGDALGAPLEFMWQNQIQIKHGTVKNMIGGGWLSLRPGQYTEDTKLMMALCESWLEKQKLDIQDLTKRYLRWYHSNPQDIGLITRTAFSLIDQGVPPEDAAERAYDEVVEKSDDGDPLTRVVPLALLFYQNQQKLIAHTIEVTQITHQDKRVVSAAVMLNLLIAQVLQGERDKHKILTTTAQILEDYPGNLYNLVPEGEKTRKDLNPSSKVADVLDIVCWAWTHHDSLEESLVAVVNLGGDSDMTGSLTGALTGAYYGEESIPERWLKVLQDRNIISQLARKLYLFSQKEA